MLKVLPDNCSRADISDDVAVHVFYRLGLRWVICRPSKLYHINFRYGSKGNEALPCVTVPALGATQPLGLLRFEAIGQQPLQLN
jgi:hypothetical protein